MCAVYAERFDLGNAYTVGLRTAHSAQNAQVNL
jgi:hypothetical protein